jgi:hypothetical protein
MQSNSGAMEMLGMRVLVAIVLLALGIAQVDAADLPTEQGEGYSTLSIGLGDRMGLQVVYDFQPGINVRPYWLAPWRHRHYYPATGEKPEIGRDEDLSAPSGETERPETFRRHWSTSSAVVVRPPRQPQRLDDEPPQNPAPLK